MRLIDAEQYRKEFLDSRDFEPMKILDFQSTVQAIPIPNNATNGDMIKAMFPNIETLRQGRIYPPPTTDNDIPIDGLIALDGEIKCSIQADLDWWNAPYKRGSENGSN